jgi:hypothetical protein
MEHEEAADGQSREGDEERRSHARGVEERNELVTDQAMCILAKRGVGSTYICRHACSREIVTRGFNSFSFADSLGISFDGR